MSKEGKARVLSKDEVDHVFRMIEEHRHTEKNRAIMQISFKLALRVQEIALLEMKEVAQISSCGKDFKLNEILTLPASYTKGSNAVVRSRSKYERKTVSFKVEEFDRVVVQIAELAKAGGEISSEMFYPKERKHKGNSRDLPMVDKELRSALQKHIRIRLVSSGSLKPSDPLFVTQKGCPYSPNTLQEHMALILRGWSGLEKAKSHSGRRTVLTNVVHEQGMPIAVAQKIAGHVSPSTTIIYSEPHPEEIREALRRLSETK
jgi:integrase